MTKRAAPARPRFHNKKESWHTLKGDPADDDDEAAVGVPGATAGDEEASTLLRSDSLPEEDDVNAADRSAAEGVEGGLEPLVVSDGASFKSALGIAAGAPVDGVLVGSVSVRETEEGGGCEEREAKRGWKMQERKMRCGGNLPTSNDDTSDSIRVSWLAHSLRTRCTWRAS